MKKILIINQHTCNHGDESAGIALIRKTKEKHKDCKIDILYNWYFKLSPEANIGKDSLKDVEHFHFPINKIDKIILRLSAFFPFLAPSLTFFSKNLREQLALIRKYDLIINGPTGINLGPYQDWYYLWRLMMAKLSGKELAIYSISFGPLDNVSPIFRKRTLEVLKYAKFLSLRDEKSQSYANSYGIQYTSAIDTTYLFKKKETVPYEYEDLLSKDYVVIVPNELYKWHTYFKKINKANMDNLYRSIIDQMILKEQVHVVLLPQMFSDENDRGYMEKLAKDINEDSITIINEMYSSDIQQEIIRNSKFVIGARYHTIVFSINNSVPFYALSYEHKIENMLSILELEEYNFDLLSYFQNDSTPDLVLKKVSDCFAKRENTQMDIEKARIKAINLAEQTFDEFEKIL